MFTVLTVTEVTFVVSALLMVFAASRLMMFIPAVITVTGAGTHHQG
jgi:hypothetical protein